MRKLFLGLTCGMMICFAGCGGTTPHAAQALSGTAGISSGRAVVNVRNFGAVGNGSDDTAPLVAAMKQVNSLGNQPVTLYFPPGNYLIDPHHGMAPHFGLLLTASNVEIRGNHAQIGLVTSSTPYSEQLHVAPDTTFYWNYLEIRGSNVRVHDMEFNSNHMTSVGGYHGDYGMFWASALDINGTASAPQDGNSVVNNRFVNIGGWAVNSSYQTNLTISGNYASNSEGMGCGGGVFGCTITDNVSEDALDAHFFSNGSIQPGTQNQNVVIRGNTATRNINGSGIDVTASWDTVVENNVVSGNANWCILVGKSWGPYLEQGPYLPSQRVTVTNNTCDKNGWYQGWPMNAEIFVGEQYARGDQGSYTPGQIASDVILKKNKITTRNAQGRGVELGYGVSGVAIDDNELDGCANSCQSPVIRIEEVGTENLTITNNHQDSQFHSTYIYLGHVGPYSISGNDMLVHQ